MVRGVERRTMKKFVKVVLWIVVVLAVLLAAAVFFLDHVILHGFNTAVPAVLGVDASLGEAQASLVKGYVSLKQMHIGNPEGYKTDGIFDLGEVTVDVDMPSLMSDTIVVEVVKVSGAEVTYEQGLRGSNIGALLDQLATEEKVEKAEEKEKEPSEKPAKKVIIRKLDVDGTRLNVAMTAMMGAAVPVPLPPIHMEGIGEESGGVTPLEAVQYIVKAVFSAVQSAVAGAGDLISGAAGKIGDGAVAAAGLVGDGASAVADGAAATAGAVADGAAATVDAVADGAAATVGAVSDGASATVGAAVDGIKAVGNFLNPFDGEESAKE